jgi:hypothetical protein
LLYKAIREALDGINAPEVLPEGPAEKAGRRDGVQAFLIPSQHKGINSFKHKVAQLYC